MIGFCYFFQWNPVSNDLLRVKNTVFYMLNKLWQITFHSCLVSPDRNTLIYYVSYRNQSVCRTVNAYNRNNASFLYRINCPMKRRCRTTL